VLGLRVDADVPPLGQVDHLLEGGNVVAAVEGGAGRADGREALSGPERPELGEGAVLGEPADDGDAVDRLGGLAVGELGVGGDVGGARDLVLVADDQDVVPGRDEVGSM
jgi:hypothetical protein